MNLKWLVVFFICGKVHRLGRRVELGGILFQKWWSYLRAKVHSSCSKWKHHMAFQIYMSIIFFALWHFKPWRLLYVRFTSHLTEKTFRLYYKDRSVNTIYVILYTYVFLMVRGMRNTNTLCDENTELNHVQSDGTCSKSGVYGVNLGEVSDQQTVSVLKISICNDV
jgi:hypothetical protein